VKKNEIRRKVLEALSSFDNINPQQPVFTHQIASKTSLGATEINSALFYLRDKNYVEIRSETDQGTLLTRITAFGRDIVENEEKLEQELPLVSVTIDQSKTQNISDIHGSAISLEGDATLSQQTSVQALFANIYQKIDQELKSDPRTNHQLKKEVKEVEDAISDGNVTIGGIKEKLWTILKKASWLKEILFPIVIEAIKRKIFG